MGAALTLLSCLTKFDLSNKMGCVGSKATIGKEAQKTLLDPPVDKISADAAPNTKQADNNNEEQGSPTELPLQITRS